MPHITKIVFKEDRRKYWVFVDYQYCCSIRERTFGAMNLEVGQAVSCDNIKEMESFHWKRSYGVASWEKEKIRLDRVTGLIESISPDLLVKVTGFGADSTSFIPAHPEESGKPDIEVVRRDDESQVLLLAEVTGTEYMRPGTTTYWVRPDKLKYAKNHPTIDTWIILHYATPEETFIFLKPDLGKDYEVSEINIRGSIEHYVEFSKDSHELVDLKGFKEHLTSKL